MSNIKASPIAKLIVATLNQSPDIASEVSRAGYVSVEKVREAVRQLPRWQTEHWSESVEINAIFEALDQLTAELTGEDGDK